MTIEGGPKARPFLFNLISTMILTVNQLKSMTLPMFKSKQWTGLTGNCPPVTVSMYDILSSFLSSNSFTIYSNSSLSGNGTSSSPLGVAQQGATSGQVLTWNGTAWVPANPTSGGQSLTLENDEITLSGGGNIPVGDLISTDTDNAITVGTDGLLFVDENITNLPSATTAGQIIYWTGLTYAVASEHIYNASPANGTTDVSLPHVPISVLSVKVFLNGVLQRITLDYTVSGNTITFTTVFGNNSKVTIFYYN